jgi:hypothetical protein
MGDLLLSQIVYIQQPSFHNDYEYLSGAEGTVEENQEAACSHWMSR